MLFPLPASHFPIFVSACLLGVNCKYSGESNYQPLLCSLIKARYFLPIPICPEQLGGLPTPRPPAEIVRTETSDSIQVKTIFGRDVTPAFKKGAVETLRLIHTLSSKDNLSNASLFEKQNHRATMAILKSNSPSCGSETIYDGTFSGRKIKGDGITAALLKKNNISIFPSKLLENLPAGYYIGLIEKRYSSLVLNSVKKEAEKKGCFQLVFH